jgi:phage terminase large subunit
MQAEKTQNKINLNQGVLKPYQPLFLGDKRYYILMGGRSAGRSYVASQLALAKLTAKEYFRCAIMRYVLGDIRNSIFQEIYDRIEEQDLLDQISIQENALKFSYENNKINGIGFKKTSGQQKSKLKSLAGYNYIIIEEADEVSEEDFMQLDDSLRTIKGDIKIILLLNPPNKNHWIIKRWFDLRNSGVEGFYKPVLKPDYAHNTGFIHTNYRMNMKNISSSSLANFRMYKTKKPEHYYNMIEGLVTEGLRGRVFKDWKVISREEYEELPQTEFYGLDFGFSNDPTALIGLKKHKNELYARELIYERGLVNRDPSGRRANISQRMEELGVDKNAPIYCDSAEPKSIEELGMDGWNVLPAEKGKDSVNAGIDMLLALDVFFTDDSENLDKEQQVYRWTLNRDKEPTNKPVDADNHAIDALRYAVFTDSKQADVGFF